MAKIISLKKVNRFYLAKHHLSQKAKSDTLLKVISDICGLHAQVASSPYISLWNRVENFQKHCLTEALHVKKTLVKVWCMRGTLHIITAKELPIYHQALSKSILENYHNFLKRVGSLISENKKRILQQDILDILEEQPLTKRELMSKLKIRFTSDRDAKIALNRTLREMAYMGLVVHAESLGHWYHFKEYKFAKLDRWLPTIDLNSIDEFVAKRQLLLKYLSHYGPASVQDFAYWTGYKVADAQHIFEDVKDKLAEVSVEGKKGNFWLLKEDLEIFDKLDLREKPYVHLLPNFDPLIMGHKDKSHIMKDEYRKRVFLTLGDVAATLLIDGHVCGTWHYKKEKNKLVVTISPFEKLEAANVEKIHSKVEALSNFMELGTLKLKYQ
ncbi:MAG TPA: winged helix DNA-binding domain-containing protein [bacterium (Candidatus Stahlbacteria)]|nr:winged helix DNA-binding domain-containing protein [Candidatus Stahlbacteria bacterium]